jgi:peptidoglycan/xylan/chitin deacetylase (PgdA/CDA1 family)
MLIAANFHYVRESFHAPHPSIFGVTPVQFERQLDALGASAQFLDTDAVIDVIDGRRPMPPRAVVVTFDDGFKEQFEIAWPILRARGIPALFFINTRPIDEQRVTTTHMIHLLRAHVATADLEATVRETCAEREIPFEAPTAAVAARVYRYDPPEAARLKYYLNHTLREDQRGPLVAQCFAALGFDEAAVSRDLYMSRDMVATLACARLVGTHGHAHLPLGLLEERVAREDVATSLRLLHEWTGTEPAALSYPFGFLEACSSAAADEARRGGVRFAFTMERAANATIDAPFFMARFSNNDVPGAPGAPDAYTFWNSQIPSRWFRSAGAHVA